MPYDDQFLRDMDDPIYPIDAWQREREYYARLYDEDDLDTYGFRDRNQEDDRFETIADTVVFERFEKVGPSIYFDSDQARPRNKEATLRSWRKPTAIGGSSSSRKAVVRKMDRRRPIKPLTFVLFDGPSGFYAMD
jgi:hypothetical protein